MMLDNATVAATAGVMAADYSPSTFLYSWGTNGTFATQEAARKAFLAAISKVTRALLMCKQALHPRASLRGTCGLCG